MKVAVNDGESGESGVEGLDLLGIEVQPLLQLLDMLRSLAGFKVAIVVQADAFHHPLFVISQGIELLHLHRVIGIDPPRGLTQLRELEDGGQGRMRMCLDELIQGLNLGIGIILGEGNLDGLVGIIQQIIDRTMHTAPDLLAKGG